LKVTRIAEKKSMQWFDVNMSGCEQGPGDPCFFDDDPVRVYMASEVEAHISELESAAVASALRVKELEKALRAVVDAFYDVDAIEAGKDPMADAIDDASKALMGSATK
jgi:hypothetical protein